MIKLYSTNCPKCNIIESKLNNLNITYDISTDIEEMIKIGIKHAPVLVVDEVQYDFNNAIRWIKEKENEKN